MKLNFFYVLAFLLVIVFASGCLKDNPKIAPTATNTPTGTFTGQFLYLHSSSKTGLVDTTKANLTLTMSLSTGFAITGDTSTVHAGSHGAFIINAYFTGIDFIDVTYPTSGTPTKNHLNGIYAYTYDGKNLKMNAFGAADTTEVIYNFTKTGN